MSMVSNSLSRTAAFAIVLGTLALASPSFAAPVDPTAPAGPPNSTVTFDSNGKVVGRTTDTSEQNGMMMMQQNGGQTTAAPQQQYAPTHRHHDHAAQQAPAPVADQDATASAEPVDHMSMKDHTSDEMRMHVEERIKNLHSKLMITKDQESQWSEVAQAMRDSEASVSRLIRERHENAKTMNAIDDLESYQAIAQAHADGLKKVNSSFKSLYESMSPEQKKNADQVFGRYEGHMPEHHGMHHKKAK